MLSTMQCEPQPTDTRTDGQQDGEQADAQHNRLLLLGRSGSVPTSSFNILAKAACRRRRREKQAYLMAAKWKRECTEQIRKCQERFNSRLIHSGVADVDAGAVRVQPGCPLYLRFFFFARLRVFGFVGTCFFCLYSGSRSLQGKKNKQHISE